MKPAFLPWLSCLWKWPLALLGAWSSRPPKLSQFAISNFAGAWPSRPQKFPHWNRLLIWPRLLLGARLSRLLKLGNWLPQFACSLALLLAPILNLCAGNFQLSVGNGTGAAGSVAVVPVSYQSDSNIVALQFDLLFPTNNLLVGVAAGGAAAAGRLVVSGQPAPGVLRVLVYTLTNAPLNTGVLVNIPFSLDPNSTLGPVSLTLSNAILANAQANQVQPVNLLPGSLTITAPPPEARLGSPTYNPDGTFQFQITNAGTSSFVIQASPDLKTWSSLSTNNPSAGVIQFKDIAAPGFKQRFYRALEEP